MTLQDIAKSRLNFMVEIFKALGEEWEMIDTGEYPQHEQNVVGTNGQTTIKLRMGHYNSNGRLFAHCVDQPNLRITMSPDKEIRLILRDLNKRLIPDAIQATKHARHQAETARQVQERISQAQERLIDVGAIRSNHPNGGLRFNAKGTTYVYRLDVTSDQEVNLDLRYVPLDKAAQILELIGVKS